jgi:hypothetical protein
LRAFCAQTSFDALSVAWEHERERLHLELAPVHRVVLVPVVARPRRAREVLVEIVASLRMPFT